MRKPIFPGIFRFQSMIFLGLVLAFAAKTCLAQSDSELSDRVAAERLTNELMSLNNRYQAAGDADKAELLSKVQAVAAKRQEFLNSIVESNPAEVLRVAIPSTIASSLPPSAKTSLEKEVDLQGELEVMIDDGPTSAKLHHFLNTGNERVELHFARRAPGNLVTGSIVRVHGVRLQNELALTSGSTASVTSNLQTVSTAPLPNTFGAQSTLVILVNFQDNTTQPFTISDVTSTLFGPGNSATNWDLENSLQQTWLTGTVVGWYTLPLTAASCPDPNTIATDANAAATAAGVNLANYSHYMYAFPFLSNCYGWLGLATIGGNPGQSWINGQPTLKLVTHEMGHNLGLYHSHGWSCGSTQVLCSSPNISEYGDSIDTMGNPSYGHFNAFQKERLGWLNNGAQPPITTVTSSGTYQIGPFENQDGTPKALKFLKSTDPTSGANTWYYVQYSQPIGFDSFLSNDPNVLSGVLAHIGTDGDGNSNDLINMAPSLNNMYYSALDVGQTFIDPNAGITMQTLSASSSGASVSITFGTPTCAHFNPTISMSPSQSQTVQAGSTVTYTVSVLNNDNAGCSASTFNLTGSVPTGWSAQSATTGLNLSPGASGSATLQVTSPAGTATGIYTVTATSTNSSASSFSASVSASYVLNTAPCTHVSPSVAFSPRTASVVAGTSQLYVVSVTNNDNSSCNSSVFNLGDAVPSGWTAALGTPSLTIAAGGNGSTSLTVTSPSNAASSTYTITGNATSTTSSSYSGSATASYVIPGGCTHANPTVTISSSQTSVPAGSTVSYAISIVDNDSPSCASASFSLSAAAPAGWSAVLANTGVTVAPGAIGSTSVKLTSPAGTPSGTYSASVSATNSSATSYTGSAAASYSVSGSNVAISANQTSYNPGQTVSLTVTVSSGSSPVSGAGVNVVMTKANGSQVTMTGTTGNNGAAVMNYKLKKTDPAGTYRATGSSSANNAAASISASTSFNVQ